MKHGSGVLNGSKLTRAFDYAHIIIEGNPLRALRIVCAQCGKSEVVRVNTMKGSTGRDGKDLDRNQHQLAARKFNAMGWEVGSSAARHLCPGCVSTRQGDQHRQENASMSNVVQVKQQATPPRTMTRDDRRIIIERLNDVYLDENKGYSDSWTDKKVAGDLGVPQAWVEKIRDENFGPVGSNEQIDDDLAKIKTHVEEMRKIAKGMNERADELERKLVDIRKAVRP